uniref:Galectin n=1 Tax=Castor canadensis TaxID=51338 RepID=A0A8C0WD60_CASCN
MGIKTTVSLRKTFLSLWKVSGKGLVCVSNLCVTTRKGPCNTSFDLPFRKDPQLQVDFHTEPSEKSDIAFHFRVYFGYSVVMNTRQSGKWDGKPFDLRILVLRNEYQVIVNGEQYYSFAHRIQPSSVQMVQVWRDICLTSVDVV